MDEKESSKSTGRLHLCTTRGVKFTYIDVFYHLDQSKCLYHDLPILIDFFVIATPLGGISS